ncbi:MAG TPA: tetratricopeptide repeat protein [Candidatus Acidoferrum sp.]|nr:tetratricopeptide repeat protein [Candidatus Acidoferrum sp.]
MTKAVTLLFGLSFLAGTASPLWAQPQANAEQTAINEAVYRQANRVLLDQKLAEARTAQTHHALPQAAKLYDECWDLVQKTGTGIDAEREQTIAGLTAVRMELAHAAQSQGQLEEAQAQVQDVLRVDPSNAAAIDFKRNNDKLMADQRGTVPSPEVKAEIPAVQEEKIHARTLVQDGKLLYELGKMDEAEKKLREALREEPRSQAALYYLSLVSEAKYSQALKEHGVTAQQNLSEVEQAWANPVKRELLPSPNLYARTNLIHTSPSREVIFSKLDRIRIDSLKFEGLPLSEVIINLSDEARKRDPERRGINFLISQNADAGAGAPATPQIGPDGNPLPAAPAEAVDVGGIQIKINPPLTDVRLADALDAIVKVAEKPIKYSIEDYAIVFSLKSTEVDAQGRPVKPLYVRSFKVDPNTFYQGLQSVGAFDFGESQNVGQNTGSTLGGGGGGGTTSSGQNTIAGAIIARVSAAPGGITGGRNGGGGQQQGGGQGGTGGGIAFITRTNNTDQVSLAARNYFESLGVDLDPVRNPGKALFFNDRLGMLLVRASMEELDIIEAAIDALNIVPPQVNIKAKFVEIEQDDTKALGFDWYLGNWLMNNNSIVGSGGSAPSFYGAPSAANPSGLFPGNAAAGTAIAPASTDQLITSGLRTAGTPTLFTLTGILTDPQFRVVMHALDQRTGAELLAQPEVTTQSGRQAQMKATDVRTIVTAFSFSQNTSATTTSGGLGTTVAPPTSTFVFPLPEQMELGPVLDVIPSVLADGYTVNLVMIPTETEFQGYEDASAFNTQLPTTAGTFPGGLVVVPTVLPRFTVRQVASSVNVWDGQTVVLGGLLSDSVATIKDKVPFLGDLPIAGSLFRNESKTTTKKNLLIFVTPTLIDPAGNRLHSEDEMPFAKESFPVQPPAAADQAKKQ